MEIEKVHHTLEAFYRQDSRILILGTMPSRKSRALGFYYMHPQNRFWTVLCEVFQEPYPKSIEDKKAFLLRHHIALWDVLSSCDMVGSSDSSIQNPVPNDILGLLQKTKIEKIYTTGKKSYELYMRYCFATTKKEAVLLPSPSPANCRMPYEELKEHYQILREDDL